MKLTLGKKLGLGFGVILALMVLTLVLTYIQASSIKETQDRAMTVCVPTIAAVKDLQRDINLAQTKGRQAVLAGNQSDRWEGAKKGFDALAKKAQFRKILFVKTGRGLQVWLHRSLGQSAARLLA